MNIDEALQELKSETNVRFSRLLTITETFFGKPRNRGTNHYPFKVLGVENQELICKKEKEAKLNLIKLSK